MATLKWRSIVYFKEVYKIIVSGTFLLKIYNYSNLFGLSVYWFNVIIYSGKSTDLIARNVANHTQRFWTVPTCCWCSTGMSIDKSIGNSVLLLAGRSMEIYQIPLVEYHWNTYDVMWKMRDFALWIMML